SSVRFATVGQIVLRFERLPPIRAEANSVNQQSPPAISCPKRHAPRRPKTPNPPLPSTRPNTIQKNRSTGATAQAWPQTQPKTAIAYPPCRERLHDRVSCLVAQAAQASYAVKVLVTADDRLPV